MAAVFRSAAAAPICLSCVLVWGGEGERVETNSTRTVPGMRRGKLPPHPSLPAFLARTGVCFIDLALPLSPFLSSSLSSPPFSPGRDPIPMGRGSWMVCWRAATFRLAGRYGCWPSDGNETIICGHLSRLAGLDSKLTRPGPGQNLAAF